MANVDDTNFITKLRMANIFPSEGVRQGTPFGMPDLSGQSGNGIDINGLFSQLMNARQNRENDAARRELVQNGLNLRKQMWSPQQLEHLPEGSPGLDRVSASSVGSSPRSNQRDIVDLSPTASDIFAKNILNPSKTSQDLEFKQAQLAQKESQFNKTNALNKQKQDLATFKAQNPNLKFQAVKGGNIVAMNPLTGEVVDTGVDSGMLSEQEKINLTGEKAQELEGTRQKNRLELEGTRQTGREKLQETRGNQALENIAARSLGKAPTEYAPERNLGNRVNAQKLIETNPEVSQYVTIGPNGQVRVDPNTPLAQLKVIQDNLYPKDIALPTEKKKTTTTTTPSKTTTPKDSLGIR